MAIRFQKRVKVLPGVTQNFSKSGMSTTYGVRGASVNVGKKGTHLIAGLPGTGLSSRTRIAGPRSPSDAPKSNAAIWIILGIAAVVLLVALFAT